MSNPDKDIQNEPRIRSVFLTFTLSTTLQCLLALACLYTLYFARTLLVPMIVALFIALLLNPLVNLLKKYYVPRTVSAVLLLAGMISIIALLGSELAGPVQKWARALPVLSQELTEQIDSISDSLQTEPVSDGIDEEQEERSGFFGFFGGNTNAVTNDSIQPETSGTAMIERLKQGGMEMMVYLLGAAPILIIQIFTVLVLILFLLIFGPRLFASYIENSKSIKDKESTLDLITTIKRSLSRYVLTISVINLGLGFSTAIALWLMGVEDALLWGVIVALLNYAPYIGLLIGFCLLSIAGVAQFGLVIQAIFPACVYLTFNIIEAQFITPLLLGRHMRLNPLVLVIWLFIWGWLWGALGVLLAVPLLVCIKLVIAQLQASPLWVKLIETRS